MNEAFNFIMHQGIYITSDPKILGSLRFYVGVCGTALVRVKRTEKQFSCLDDG